MVKRRKDEEPSEFDEREETGEVLQVQAPTPPAPTPVPEAPAINPATPKSGTRLIRFKHSGSIATVGARKADILVTRGRAEYVE